MLPNTRIRPPTTTAPMPTHIGTFTRSLSRHRQRDGADLRLVGLLRVAEAAIHQAEDAAGDQHDAQDLHRVHSCSFGSCSGARRRRMRMSMMSVPSGDFRRFWLSTRTNFGLGDRLIVGADQDRGDGPLHVDGRRRSGTAARARSGSADRSGDAGRACPAREPARPIRACARFRVATTRSSSTSVIGRWPRYTCASCTSASSWLVSARRTRARASRAPQAGERRRIVRPCRPARRWPQVDDAVPVQRGGPCSTSRRARCRRGRSIPRPIKSPTIRTSSAR